MNYELTCASFQKNSIVSLFHLGFHFDFSVLIRIQIIFLFCESNTNFCKMYVLITAPLLRTIFFSIYVFACSYIFKILVIKEALIDFAKKREALIGKSIYLFYILKGLYEERK